MSALVRCFAGALLVTSLVAPAGAAPKCPNVTTSGRWATITLPSEVAYVPLEIVPAASRKQHDVFIAVSGRTLRQSTDGGCTWKTAYSLDTDSPPNSQARLHPSIQFKDVAVSRNRTGARTVYALATNGSSDLTVTMPFTMLVSTDGGSRWRLTDPPLGPEMFTEEPRCTNTSTITAGPDPRVAHITCVTSSWGELALTVSGVQCNSVTLVTTDAAASWREVTPRHPDPARVASRDGCGQMYGVVTDERTPHVLWELSGCSADLWRSVDDGKTRSSYAKFDKRLACNDFVLATGTQPAGGSLVAACGARTVAIAKPGKMVESSGVPMRAHQIGSFKGCAVDSRTGRVIAFYLDGEHRSRVFSYDPTRRTWTPLGVAPAKKGEQAWSEFGTVVGTVTPTWHYVYAQATWGGSRLVRLAL